MLDPLLAILAIVVPLGLAYVVIRLQTRKYHKEFAGEHDDLSQKGKELLRTDEKRVAR